LIAIVGGTHVLIVITKIPNESISPTIALKLNMFGGGNLDSDCGRHPRSNSDNENSE